MMLDVRRSSLMRRFLMASVMLTVARPASAQRRERVTIEGSLGVARVVTSIPFTSTASLAFDAIVALRARETPGHSLVLGASISRFDIGGADASCRLLPDDSCAPSLPNLGARSILAGWESTSRIHESVRVLLGPVWFHRYYGDGNSAGVQGRLDLSSHMRGRLAFLVSGRWSHVPSFQDRALNYFSLGVGFRLRVM